MEDNFDKEEKSNISYSENLFTAGLRSVKEEIKADIEETRNQYKRANPLTMIGAFLFGGAYFAAAAMAITTKNETLKYILAAAMVLSVIGAIVVVLAIPKIKLAKLAKNPNAASGIAMVAFCKVHSATHSTSGRRISESYKYKIIMDLEDGTQLTAIDYCKYEEGQQLIVKYLPHKPKYCIITGRKN